MRQRGFSTKAHQALFPPRRIRHCFHQGASGTVSTKAHRALFEEREAIARKRKAGAREPREDEKRQRYGRHQQERKAKHRDK